MVIKIKNVEEGWGIMDFWVKFANNAYVEMLEAMTNSSMLV